MRTPRNSCFHKGAFFSQWLFSESWITYWHVMSRRIRTSSFSTVTSRKFLHNMQYHFAPSKFLTRYMLVKQSLIVTFLCGIWTSLTNLPPNAVFPTDAHGCYASWKLSGGNIVYVHKQYALHFGKWWGENVLVMQFVLPFLFFWLSHKTPFPFSVSKIYACSSWLSVDQVLCLQTRFTQIHAVYPATLTSCNSSPQWRHL